MGENVCRLGEGRCDRGVSDLGVRHIGRGGGGYAQRIGKTCGVVGMR